MPLATEEKREYSRWQRRDGLSGTQDVYARFSEELLRGPVNGKRRDACRDDLLRFCRTYGAESFPLPWSPQHHHVAKLIQSAITGGEMSAFAMPRGSGKSTLCRWAVIWSIFYGHSTYTVLIGATATSATKQIKAIKAVLRSNPLLWEDFPDALACVRHIEGQPRRCEGQKFIGQPTYIEWTKDAIVIPIVDVQSESFTSAVIDVTGITGEIRGRFHQLADGRVLRPTMAIVDDPQTRASAKSVPQVRERIDILTGDIKYLAGPEQPLGIVMPCTVIEPDDAADKLLDRSRHPEWHGARSKFFDEMPEDIGPLWEEYGECVSQLQRDEMPLTQATEFYEKHRKEMDAGFVVTWPERYYAEHGEVSAIQHGMNAFLRDRPSFMSEFQNEPEENTGDGAELPTAEFIASKQSGFERGVVPPDVATITTFVDISETVLWWAVIGWSPRCDGYVLDYGAFPEQGRRYFTLGDLRRPLAMRAPKGSGTEGAIQWGLTELFNDLMGRRWVQPDGTEMQVSRAAVDSAYGMYSTLVYQFCNRSKYASRIVPARGHGTKGPVRAKPQPGEIRGDNWRIAKTAKSSTPVLFVHTNAWKDFTFNRLATQPGDRGCLQLFGKGQEDHRMFCDQLTAEYRERASFGELEFWQYMLPPHKPDNHFLDCVVGNCVLASVEGLSVTSEQVRPPMRRKKKYGVVSRGV